MGETIKRAGGDVIRDVMLFRDARGWGVTATINARLSRHWRLRTESQARYLAAVLELGPAKLPDGSSGSRRNARLLGRETCPVTAPEPRRHYDWPGGPPRTSRWEEPEDGRRDCRFDSLNAAVESGLELAGAASVAACGRMATLPWPVACEAGVGAGPLFGDPGSLSAALDAALADLSGGAGEESFEAAVEEPFGLASGDFI